jgi:hypothetical protein
VPLAEISGAAFMREVVYVHRELFAECADLYGRDPRLKIACCLAVSDAERAHAAAQRDESPCGVSPIQIRSGADARCREPMHDLGRQPLVHDASSFRTHPQSSRRAAYYDGAHRRSRIGDRDRLRRRERWHR